MQENVGFLRKSSIQRVQHEIFPFRRAIARRPDALSFDRRRCFGALSWVSTLTWERRLLRCLIFDFLWNEADLMPFCIFFWADGGKAFISNLLV